MSYRSKLSTDIIVSTAATLSIRLRGLIFIPLISGGLSVTAFGAYTQVLAVARLLEVLAGVRLYDVLVRYGQERDQDASELFYTLFTVVVVSSAFVAAFMFSIAQLLSQYTLSTGEYAAAYQAGAVLVLLRAVFRIQVSYFKMNGRIKFYSIIETANTYAIVSGVAAAILIFSSDLAGVFDAIILGDALTVVLLQGLIVREIGVATPSFERIGEYLRYSVPLTTSTLASTVSSRVDRFLIGAFLGAQAVGVYSIAYQIATAIMIYVKPIRITFFPEFSQLLENGKLDRCSRYLRQGVRYFLLISLPTVGGMYLIGPDVIGIIAGEGANPSGILVATIALGVVGLGVDNIYWVVLTADKRTLRATIIRWVGAVANLGLSIPLVLEFGIIGAAVATLGTYALTAGLMYYSSGKVFETTFVTGTLIRTALATVAMVVLTGLVTNSLVYSVVVGALSYGVVVLALGEFSRAELRQIQSSLPML
ncbi:oligosaccharide flippase family protein [Halococcus salifodinae]|uniref:Polysaccharide biosynthesis protein n=1 Tax=Halococcus salifodinae DSM 8989 TaxID=1227456 RepID=M0N169_9EURY|nr:oligosaccharide flippase family protein [Halococcus salifodinae]EMA51717.1 polysaccharide biosynthesis protein [Halococcus salifodinae DSM 8989]